MNRSTGPLFVLLCLPLPAQSGGQRAIARETLEKLSTDELLALGREVRRRSEPPLLTTPRQFDQRFAQLLALPGTGTVRLLPRGRYVASIDRRGGGAYYSFAERTHSYDHQPDLALDGDSYQTAFYGGTQGVLVDLGPADIAALAADPAADIEGVSDGVRQLLWLEHAEADPGFGRRFGDAARKLGAESRVPATEGHSYLLRAVLPGEHDILVAFTFVEQDRHGHLIVWRILRSWGGGARPNVMAQPPADSGIPPPSLAAALQRMGLDDLIETTARIRDLADRRLLTPPEHLAPRHAALLRGPDTGLARLVWPLRYTQVLRAGERGSYYSFATRSNDYDAQPDIALQGMPGPRSPVTGRAEEARTPPPRYATGFYGGCSGFVADLGPGPRQLDALAAAGEPPAGIGLREWQVLCADDPVAAQGAGGSSLGPSAIAEVGHTYLLRAVLPGEHDHLVAFTTLEQDVHGHTILWRVLKTWPAERR